MRRYYYRLLLSYLRYEGSWLVGQRKFMIRKKIATSGRRNRNIGKFAADLPLHMPPVQFATLISLPWQDRPP